MQRALFSIIITLLLLCGCQKEDKNGDLGGFWKMMETVDYKGVSADLKEKNRFWRVQLELMNIGGVYARFQHVSDSLYVQLLEHDGNNLYNYGIYKQNEKFAVEHLDRNGMILKSDSVWIRFRKF